MGRPRIVVIDDHPAVRHGLAAFLGDTYELVLHGRAAGAVAVVQQEMPTLVLIDMHLEYRHAGLAVVRALRADARTAELPLLVWSTDGDVQTQVAALQLPGVTAVSKFDEPAELREVIARVAAASSGPAA